MHTLHHLGNFFLPLLYDNTAVGKGMPQGQVNEQVSFVLCMLCPFPVSEIESAGDTRFHLDTHRLGTVPLQRFCIAAAAMSAPCMAPC